MAKTFSKQGGYLKYEDTAIPLIKTYNFNQLEYLVSGNNIVFPDAMTIAYNDAELTNVFAKRRRIFGSIRTLERGKSNGYF